MLTIQQTWFVVTYHSLSQGLTQSLKHPHTAHAHTHTLHYLAPTGGQQRFRCVSAASQKKTLCWPYLQPIFQLCLYWEAPFFFHSCISYWHPCILMIHKTWFMSLGKEVNAVYRNMDVVRTKVHFARSLLFFLLSCLWLRFTRKSTA